MTFPYEENSEPLTPFCHVTRWTDCTFHILALIILTIFFIWKHILPSIKTKQFRATISLIPHILLPITCIFRFVADFISVGICGAALDEGITRALLCASSNYIASFAFSIPLVNWARLLERTKKRKIGTTIVIVLIGFFMAIVPAVFLILIWVGYLRNKALGVAINAVELWYCAATSLLLAVCYLVEGIMILRYIHSLSVRISQRRGLTAYRTISLFLILLSCPWNPHLNSVPGRDRPRCDQSDQSYQMYCL